MRRWTLPFMTACLISLTLPARADDGATRVAWAAWAHPVTGQAEISGAWLGLMYGHALIPHALYVDVGLGYAPVGYAPGDGLNLLSGVFGVELALPIPPLPTVEWFARVLVGYNYKLPPDREIAYTGALFNIQPGLRFGRFDLFASVGTGPATGFNLGLGVALAMVD